MKNLDELLEEYSVIPVDDLDNYEDVPAHKHLKGWFGVVDNDGIQAYFSTELEAFRYRLNLINLKLNR